jgi:hypothetical protein
MATVRDGTTTSAAGDAPNAFHKDVEEFSGHCAYIRSVYIFAIRIWRDSTADQRKMMESIAPSFFSDLGQVLAEYVVLAACRVTDPANDGKNENFTVEMFVNSFPANSQTSRELDGLRQEMTGSARKYCRLETSWSPTRIARRSAKASRWARRVGRSGMLSGPR